jgi:hypothetical protein
MHDRQRRHAFRNGCGPEERIGIYGATGYDVRQTEAADPDDSIAIRERHAYAGDAVRTEERHDAISQLVKRPRSIGGLRRTERAAPEE